MTVPAIHEDEVEALGLPGRELRWLVAPGAIRAEHCSLAVIRIAAGDRVRPAHSHPHGEEVIYVLSGSGRVLVNGEVTAITSGSTVLFPRGHVHMVHNSGDEEMKIVCFFAPPTGLENYRMHEDVDFPD